MSIDVMEPRQPAAMPSSAPIHVGMPPFDDSGPNLSFFEFWKPRYFYIPVVAHWMWLSLKYRGIALPSIANPLFPFGGLTYDSKKVILDTVMPEGRPYFAMHYGFVRGSLSKDAATEAKETIAKSNATGIALPFVAKPDIGCRGVGVRLIRSETELADYLDKFPHGHGVLIQELVDHQAEAGIFYIRQPDETHGRIFSITLKYFPYVFGDGQSTLRELILSDPRAGKIAHVYFPRHAKRLEDVIPAGEPFRLAFAGSHSRGTIFRNGESYITPGLADVFDRIARTVPEFYFGRFDVRFGSMDELQRGENFKIVEINGAGGEATHIWDRNMSLNEAYRTLFKQNEYLWRAGALNRKRGYRPSKIRDIWRAYHAETGLWKLYPIND